jgi:hypothetical protein
MKDIDDKAADVANRIFKTIKYKLILMSGDWQKIDSDNSDTVDRVINLAAALANSIGADLWFSENVDTARASICLTPTRHTRH